MIDFSYNLRDGERASSLAVGFDVVDRDHRQVLCDACEGSSWISEELPIIWM